MVNPKTNVYNINLINEVVDSYLNMNKYDYIYISIGSKYVCSESKYAKFQMIPKNLLLSENNRILIIIIDQFMSKENVKENQNILEKHIIFSRNIFDIIFINGFFIYFDYKTLKINDNKDVLLKFFNLTKMIEQNYLANQIMICNFVKFKNRQSMYEMYIHKTMTKYIYDYLNPQYYDCLYEWLGYDKQKYIVKYKGDIQFDKIDYVTS